MPKVHDTRKQKADLFLARLRVGPAFSAHPDGTPFTPAEATAQYQRWAESWMVDPARLLIMELRGKKRT